MKANFKLTEQAVWINPLFEFDPLEMKIGVKSS